MKPVLIAMPGNDAATAGLAQRLDADAGSATVRRFPDGESYVRVATALGGRDAIIVCTLDRPDDKLVPLLLLASAARDSGARSVGLVAPYLAYMRQDAAFHPGETASARHVAAWLSSRFDGLVTVDPHLHRIVDISQLYAIPVRVVHAADRLADWLHEQVHAPLLIGPDEESAQWVAQVARRAGAPFVVLRKTRRGDRDVEVSLPDVERWRTRTPVLVDDIVSTGRTMIETVQQLRRAGLAAPWCVAVHAVFAQNAFDDLLAAGAAGIASCDTIAHRSNRIGLAAPLAAAVAALLADIGRAPRRAGPTLAKE